MNRKHNKIIKKSIIKLSAGAWIIGAVLMAGCSVAPDIVVFEDSPPKIQSVQTIRINHEGNVATSSFRIGEKGNFIIVAIDSDKDIEKLYIKGFSPESSNDPALLESGPIELEPQSKTIASYSLPEPIDVPGPPGRWRIDVQLEDKAKNLSNVYTLYTIVH